MSTHKNTKIVATLGPASSSVKTLEKMLKAGLNVARLNFSHGTYTEFEQLIKNIHTASANTGIHVAILQDLQGPKIRVGEMPPEGITLKNSEKIILTSKKIIGTADYIPVQYAGLPQDVKKDDHILLCDGMIELKVLKTSADEIQCQITTGGNVLSHKGINVPTASISLNPITKKDLEDLAFGMKHDVDYVAMSFVKSAQNIEELRNHIKKLNGHAKIIAKIERHEAIANLEEIIQTTDAVMVARGDLGVEISAFHVPIIQKKIIHLANLYGKPVITATEMLQSMIENPRATRAEVSDVANAILDHTDAVMLSNESAVGKYPVEAVKTLYETSKYTEDEMKHHENFLPKSKKLNPISSVDAACFSAVELAENLQAKYIIAITESGFTAEQVSKFRPKTPVIAITNHQKTVQWLQLVWGLQKIFLQVTHQNSTNFSEIKKLLKEKNLVKPGDKVVIISHKNDQQLICPISI